MNISYRLRTIAECVTSGSIVADVGCDHCLTSIYLIEQGIARKVYAMDINEAPLITARKNISEHGLSEHIIIKLSDGIKALTSDDNVDTILISGMGGSLIINILRELEKRCDINNSIKELVLSPQSDIPAVRRYLHSAGYRISDEKMIYDSGKYYTILCAVIGTEEYNNVEYEYGKILINQKDDVFCKYLVKELEKKYKILDNIREALFKKSLAAGKTKRLKAEALRVEADIKEGVMIMGNDNLIVCGEKCNYDSDTIIRTIAEDYSDRFNYDIIAAYRDGKVCELNKKLEDARNIEFITTDTVVGHKVYVRGVTMMMLKALYNVYGTENIDKISVESSIGRGDYCEIHGKNIDIAGKLTLVEKKMHEYVERDIVFAKEHYPTDKAVELFASLGMKDKEKLFRYRRASQVNVYNLDGYYDYFYGSMPPSTGMLKYFKLQTYNDGIVLVVPDKNNPDEVKEFKDSPKFYNILMESNNWGRSMNIDTVGALNDAIADGRINDVIMIQEALHEKKIGDIAADIAKDKNKKIILIAGPSSSGKTTFSHRLSIQLSTLGLKPHPIPVDNYFVDRDRTPRNEDGSFDYECLEAIDVEQFNEDMNGLLEGKRVELPTYNFITGGREYKGNYKQLGKDDILVIEGIHGLNDKLSHSLPRDSKYKIYISALTQLNIDEHNRIPTTDGRLIRRIVRDARTRGNDATDTIAMWPSVRHGEDNYIFPFQEDADAMFNSALIYELAVLKQYAEPLLFKVDRNSPEYIEAKRLLKFLDYFLGVSSEDINHNSILREFIGGSVFPV